MTRRKILLFLYLILLFLTPLVVVRWALWDEGGFRTLFAPAPEEEISPVRLQFRVEFPDWNNRENRYTVDLEPDRSAVIGPAGGTAALETKIFLHNQEIPTASLGRCPLRLRFEPGPEFLSAGGRILASSDTALRLQLPALGGSYRLFVDHTAVIQDLSESGETLCLYEGRNVLYLLVPVPCRVAENGFLGPYPMGRYPDPNDPRAPRAVRDHAPAYAPPSRFIEVTPGLRPLFISEHFRLDDFVSSTRFPLPPGAPHYLALDYRVVEKLERLIEALEAAGLGPIHITINSAFRSPHYNNAENTDRAAYSMHLYGGAVDFKIDGALGRRDENRTVDLTGDGRVTMEDLRLPARILERMEEEGRAATGGIGIYDSEHADGNREFFLHTDTRGYRARWGYIYRRGRQTAEDRWWRTLP